MKRFLVSLSAILPLALAACSQPEVVVEAQIPAADGSGTTPLANLPVRLLPYDRDAIFDSLAAAYGEPEPAIPPEILQAQEQVQQAQTEWQVAEQRWATVRDSLKTLSEETQSLAQRGLRTTPQYRQAFERFSVLEKEEGGLRARSQAAFQRFNQIQQQTLAQVDSIRVVREAWAERAFADFDQVVAAKLQQAGREELADTTNANGLTVFRAPEGQWWVYARYALPVQELYWNEEVTVSGDSTHVPLTQENAESRPVM